MELIYTSGLSGIKPSEIEFTKTTVYLRKDIVGLTTADENGNESTKWTYQVAKMSHEEFAEYSKNMMAKNAIASQDVPKNIGEILTGQQNGDYNQLTIMEALADLYGMILDIKTGGSSDG